MATSRCEAVSGPVTDPVEQYPRPGAELAPCDPQPAQLRDPGQPGWVALGGEQSLFATPEMDQCRLPAAQQGTGERAIALAGAVLQVDRRGVRGALPYAGQSVEAAPCADGHNLAVPGSAQHDVEPGVVAAR
jgi:hypothetical protein